jgi:hypothetical protein
VETARIQEEQKRKQEQDRNKKQIDEYSLKKERKYFDSDGKPYSFNDPK